MREPAAVSCAPRLAELGLDPGAAAARQQRHVWQGQQGPPLICGRAGGQLRAQAAAQPASSAPTQVQRGCAQQLLAHLGCVNVLRAHRTGVHHKGDAALAPCDHRELKNGELQRTTFYATEPDDLLTRLYLLIKAGQRARAGGYWRADAAVAEAAAQGCTRVAWGRRQTPPLPPKAERR